MLYVLIFPLSILGFSAIALMMPNLGLAVVGNSGPYGLSEILYTYTSTTARWRVQSRSLEYMLSFARAWSDETMCSSSLHNCLWAVLRSLPRGNGICERRLSMAGAATFYLDISAPSGHSCVQHGWAMHGELQPETLIPQRRPSRSISSTSPILSVIRFSLRDSAWISASALRFTSKSSSLRRRSFVS
jgi:Potassium-transporting ATPase A subunit